MINELNQLIQTLREELQQYGEMLARLDDQQNHVLRRAGDDLLLSVDAVQGQSRIIQRARQQRQKCQSAVASLVGLPANAPFTQLIPRLPEDYRPLLEALVEENNDLLARVQQRARQNHLLLARSVELMQGFLDSFTLSGACPVYNGNGNLTPRPVVTRSIYEAVG
jgi:DNA repair exonuclease SbcCD ATPase subunit